MVLPEPRSFDGGPPTAGAWPSLGAAARLLLGLLRGALLGWWRSGLWAGARLTLRPRRGPWLGPRRGPWLRPRRGPWLGWCSDHRGGRSWLALGSLRGRCTASGAERAKRSWRLEPWLSSAAQGMLTGAGNREAGPAPPPTFRSPPGAFRWRNLTGSRLSGAGGRAACRGQAPASPSRVGRGGARS